jgi:hypothetical protein
MTENSSSTPNPYPVAAAAPAGGGAGGVSFVLAIVLVALGLVLQIVAQLAPQVIYDLQLGASAIGGFFAVANVVTGLLAVVVVILGAIGIQPRQPQGRLAAAAGLGIGAAHLASVLVALVSPFVLDAVL